MRLPRNLISASCVSSPSTASLQIINNNIKYPPVIRMIDTRSVSISHRCRRRRRHRCRTSIIKIFRHAFSSHNTTQMRRTPQHYCILDTKTANRDCQCDDRTSASLPSAASNGLCIGGVSYSMCGAVCIRLHGNRRMMRESKHIVGNGEDDDDDE